MDPIPHLGDPTDQRLKEYIVTLKKMSDSEEFYKDMEEPGGPLYIPNREVMCLQRRPISRNTHYLLTYDEAVLIKKDPRVLTVELNPIDLGFYPEPFGFEQTSSNFDKRTASDPIDINWGFVRCLRKTNISDWGIEGTVNLSAELLVDCSGKNVDIVVMDDGAPYPNTYEYAQNADGTGYSRMVEYNWEIHNPVVTGGAVSDYNYKTTRLQAHGAHTTGTCAGNTQGWARDSNIYNITFYDSIDYVREFHRNKPINPLTGVKNPTIMNNSWGYRSSSINSSFISKLTIRGVDYFPTSGSSGSFVWDPNILANVARLNIGGAFPARNAPTDEDMVDAMLEGIIIVASAGNSYFYQDVIGGLDYDNTMIYNNVSYYIHRGSSPGAADGGTEETKIICSGAMGQHNELPGDSVYRGTGIEVGDYKAEFSNYGPRIDCWAPGSAIQSIWRSNTSLYDNVNATDPRLTSLGGFDSTNNNFKKCPGTSMSGPQTAGVLACLAEKYPRMTQKEAREYIRAMCPPTLESTDGGAQDFKDAGFSFNPSSNRQVLLLVGTRVPTLDVGGFHKVAYPEITAAHRPTNGQMIPRKRSLYSYNNQASFNLSASASTASQNQTVTINLNTSGITDGTVVPYIITSKQSGLSTVTFDSGFSGIYGTNFLVSGTSAFDVNPNKGNRITTAGVGSGSVTNITNSIQGQSGLTNIGFPTFGNSDDGYWEIILPFNISFLSQTYDRVYVGTNTYITFGAGSVAYERLGTTVPNLPKIMISAADNSCQRLFTGVFGAAGSRIFRIRYEGTANHTGQEIPNMIYEATFYENANNQIDIHTAQNARIITRADVYNFDSSDISVPLCGNITVNNNTGSLPITILTLDSFTLNIRLGIFPTPDVNIQVN